MLHGGTSFFQNTAFYIYVCYVYYWLAATAMVPMVQLLYLACSGMLQCLIIIKNIFISQ